MKKLEYFLADESATIAVGDGLAKVLLSQNEQCDKAQPALLVYLNGD